MADVTQTQTRLQDRLQQAPPPEWVRKMVDHYHRTGTFRSQDIRRLLGDPTRGVEIKNHASLSACFATGETGGR